MQNLWTILPWLLSVLFLFLSLLVSQSTAKKAMDNTDEVFKLLDRAIERGDETTSSSLRAALIEAQSRLGFEGAPWVPVIGALGLFKNTITGEVRQYPPVRET